MCYCIDRRNALIVTQPNREIIRNIPLVVVIRQLKGAPPVPQPALVRELEHLLETQSLANDARIVELLAPGVEYVLRRRKTSATHAHTLRLLRSALGTYRRGSFRGLTDLLELILRLIRD